MVTHVDMSEAQAQLPSLLAKVEAGETVVIERDGKPMAQITVYTAPLQEEKPLGKRQFGRLKGKIFIDDDLFAQPLPDDLLRAWGELPE